MSDIDTPTTTNKGEHTEFVPASLNLLTAEECERARQAVHELKNYWVVTDRQPYYRLGAVSYRDLADGHGYSYYASARRMNPILLERFGWLYDRLSAVLSKHIGNPVNFAMDAALPGFHIYLAYLEPQGREWNIHWDGHIRWVRFSGAESSEQGSTVSFTATISLPRSGGGLNMWDEAYSPEHPNDFQEQLKVMPHTFHPYGLGQIFVHSGDFYHQIAAMDNIGPTDERITLQGNGIRYSDRTVVFW